MGYSPSELKRNDADQSCQSLERCRHNLANRGTSTEIFSLMRWSVTCF